MPAEHSGSLVRRAIGGDATAAGLILADVDRSDDPLVVVMAALLDGDVTRLDVAQALAQSSRDRQVVAIAAAHLAGREELVDALARDHLVAYPDSLIVSWIASASRAGGRDRPTGHE